MDEVIKLQQKIVPELIELLEKRYNILKTIYYNEPIGRRILSVKLGIGERNVRNEIEFMKGQNLISINTDGMKLTKDGEIIIEKLKDFIHEIRGLSEVEDFIRTKLNLKKVIIVPGDYDDDSSVLDEMGRAAASYLKSIIKDGNVIALTGGSTIKAVIDNVQKTSKGKDILVVPARGGMGRNVQTQSNTLAAKLAEKLNASYRLLHVPDNLSDTALKTIINEKDIKEVLEKIQNTNILLYGIGRADEMARRRGMTPEQMKEIESIGAVGEAFGYYFSKDGRIVYKTPTVGVSHDNINKIDTLIAVAGGRSKAHAIAAIISNKFSEESILITDEGAAKEIADII